MTRLQLETISQLQTDIQALELMRTRLETQVLKCQACIEEILAQRDGSPFPFATAQQPVTVPAAVEPAAPSPDHPTVRAMVVEAGKAFNGSQFSFVDLKGKTIELYPVHEALIRRGIYTALHGPHGLIAKGQVVKSERGLTFKNHENGLQ